MGRKTNRGYDRAVVRASAAAGCALSGDESAAEVDVVDSEARDGQVSGEADDGSGQT
jgi:hypothetical protein